MRRRQLLVGLGGGLVVAAVGAAGCGHDRLDPSPARGDGGACLGDAAGEIGDNHGHAVLRIPAAHLVDVRERVYDLSPIEGHLHSVRVQPAEFRQLAADGEVIVFSTKELGHAHTITLRCG